METRNFYFIPQTKVGVTSSPFLNIFDPDKPKLLKSEWRAEGMGWILMHPANDDESQRTMRTLRETGECLFNLGKNGARLRPIAFGLISCTDFEREYH